MKQTFTRILLFITGFFLLFVGNTVLYGQSVLEITEPADAAGVYQSGLASFFSGCIENDGVTGEIIVAEDGSDMPTQACGPITNDISGKIALVDRGNCNFTEKALNAQDAGAIAVIICNNIEAPLSGSGIVIPSGESDTPITIPTIALSLEDCNVFRSFIPLTATIRLEDNNLNVLWGDEEGQGDFNGGLNDWTAVTISCNNEPSEFNVWQWRENGDASRGSFTGDAVISINSPTRCNGAMVFDSDFYDTNGDAVGGADDPAIGSGPCPAVQIGELISPVIDISDSDATTISLSFYQNARQFNSTFLVGYSLDGGSTWTDIPVNAEVDTNDEISDDEIFQFVPLPGAEGAANLRIRFRMEANYYYWVIDDVKIVEGFANDLEITDFFYTPASAIQPSSMIVHDPFSFSATVANTGSVAQTNVNFFAAVQEIVDLGDGNFEFNTVYVDSAFYDVIPANDTITVQIDSLWNPDVSSGLYRIVYQVFQSEQDQDLDNNFMVALFGVTDNVFAKEFDLGPEGTRNPDGGHAYANLYTIPSAVQEEYVLGEISFRSSTNADDGPLDGNTINVYLLEATEEVDEGFANLDLATSSISFDEQLEFTGFAEYTFPEESGQDGIFSTTLEGFDSGDSRIPLIPGKGYAAVVEYPNAVRHIFHRYSTEIDYRFLSSLLFIENDRWYTGFAGENGFGAVIQMSIALATSIDETPLPDGTMSVFPNPATDYVQAQFNFENQIDATITLAGIDGKVIEYRNLPLLNDIVEFNTNNLAEGMYIMRVATAIGTKTEKFLVQRP